MNNFCPDAILKNVFMIDEAFLKQHNIKGVIFDIDNTLAPFSDAIMNDETAEYIKRLNQNGIKTAIISNNNAKRVEKFNRATGMFYVAKALKPKAYGYIEVKKHFNLESDEILSVGDQLFTDIWGAKRQGMMAVLVRPIRKDTQIQIILKRIIEKPIMYLNMKLGNISKEGYNLFYKGE